MFKWPLRSCVLYIYIYIANSWVNFRWNLHNYFLSAAKTQSLKIEKHWRLIKCSYFPAQWPFAKAHLGVSLSINICPPDTGDKLSPEGEKLGKGREWFCPHLPLSIYIYKKNARLFFQRKHALFPSSCPLPDSPWSARRDAIDYLAHKMDSVMFRVNV